jgi:cytochrome c
MKALLIAAVVSAAIAAPVAAQDVADGERVFRQCRACHTVGPEARNLIGPVLNGLEGRTSGTVEGYNYSDANKKAGITWTEASFKEYIANPTARVPGTKMAYVGLKNEKDAADLWAYLKQFKADGSKQ